MEIHAGLLSRDRPPDLSNNMHFARQHKTRAHFRLILSTADWPCYRCDNYFSGNRSKRSWILITGRRNGAQNLSKGGHGKGVRLLRGDNWHQIGTSMDWFLPIVPLGKHAKEVLNGACCAKNLHEQRRRGFPNIKTPQNSEILWKNVDQTLMSLLWMKVNILVAQAFFFV